MVTLELDVVTQEFESVYVHGSFDEKTKKLDDLGYEVISLPENALLLIQQGVDYGNLRYGNLTREGFLYFPDGKIKLVRDSPALESASEAVNAYHTDKKRFFPTEDQIERALNDSIDFPREGTEIPTNRFDSDELTVWAFGEEQRARDYGEFLRRLGTNNMPFSAESVGSGMGREEIPYARQVLLTDISYPSAIWAHTDFAFNLSWLRGIKYLEKNGEGIPVDCIYLFEQKDFLVNEEAALTEESEEPKEIVSNEGRRGHKINVRRLR